MEIGAGITIGGGITLQVESGGGGGGGGGAFVTGTLTVGSDTVVSPPQEYYGYGTAPGGTFGSYSSTPSSMFRTIMYLYMGAFKQTLISFEPGTYGSTVISATQIDSKTNIDITIDGVTLSTTLQAGMDNPLAVDSSVDYFGLAGKIGQTLNFTMTMTS